MKPQVIDMSMIEPMQHSRTNFSIKSKLDVLDNLFGKIKPKELCALTLYASDNSRSVIYGRNPINIHE